MQREFSLYTHFILSDFFNTYVFCAINWVNSAEWMCDSVDKPRACEKLQLQPGSGGWEHNSGHPPNQSQPWTKGHLEMVLSSWRCRHWVNALPLVPYCCPIQNDTNHCDQPWLTPELMTFQREVISVVLVSPMERSEYHPLPNRH